MISEAANDAKTLTRLALRTFVWASTTVVFAAVTIFCFASALFVWLSTNFGSLIAFLCLGGVFLFMTAACAVTLVFSNARLHERARHLTVTKPATWLDPTIVVTALDLARILGGRRLSLAVAGFSLALWLFKKPSENRRSTQQRRHAGEARYFGDRQ